MAEYPGALDMFVDRSRVFRQNDHTWIVIHKTAGFNTIEELGAYFAGTSLRTSTHFGIGRDGRIAQFVRLDDGAGGNCCLEDGHAPYLPTNINLNLKTISIEHIDPRSDNSTPCTPEQLQASFKLVAWLCERFNIPKSAGTARGGIIRHADIAPQSRARCPGNYPMDQLFLFLGGQSMGIPTGWKDDGKILTAPNGIGVQLGFRDWILNHPWDAGNWPQCPEYHSNQVLLHNASVGAGQVQVFRDGMLWFTPERGVIQEPYNGLEIMAAYQVIASQQGQLKALQTQIQTLQSQLATSAHDYVSQVAKSAISTLQQLV